MDKEQQRTCLPKALPVCKIFSRSLEERSVSMLESEEIAIGLAEHVWMDLQGQTRLT